MSRSGLCYEHPAAVSVAAGRESRAPSLHRVRSETCHLPLAGSSSASPLAVGTTTVPFRRIANRTVACVGLVKVTELTVAEDLLAWAAAASAVTSPAILSGFSTSPDFCDWSIVESKYLVQVDLISVVAAAGSAGPLPPAAGLDDDVVAARDVVPPVAAGVD